MRTLSIIAWLGFTCLLQAGEVEQPHNSRNIEYARVVRQTPRGYEQHPQARQADFSDSFQGFNPQTDGAKSNDATFGAPRWLAARIDGQTYLICVDNTPGILTLHRATRRDGVWMRTKGSREIYHPELYNRLREAGLNIHTLDELKGMTKEKRQQALSGKDAPIRQTKHTKERHNDAANTVLTCRTRESHAK